MAVCIPLAIYLNNFKMNIIKDTHREKAPWNKTPAFTKSLNVDVRVVGSSNQHFIRGSHTEKNFLKKVK